jgi:hypothetical protein
MTWLARSTRTSPLGKAVVLLAAGMLACGMSSQESALMADGPGAPSAGGGDLAGPEGAADSGARGVIGRASPLCGGGADAGLACDPDSELACATTPAPTADAGGADGAVPFGDGGAAYDAGATGDAKPPPSSGCRVTRGPGDVPSVTCGTAGAGRDGDRCEKSQECAAGFECSAEGICRRYCCDGACEAVSLNGATTFCDVQQTRQTTWVKVPLCMPLRRCTLFGSECKQAETCSIVTPAGDTGCIATGNATVGQDCETAHCMEGQACLGVPGHRTCKLLCRRDKYDCPKDKACKGSSLFPPGFGVCEAPGP